MSSLFGAHCSVYCSTVIFYFDDIPLPAVTDQRPRGFHGGRVIWLKPSALCGVFDGQQTVAGICIGAEVLLFVWVTESRNTQQKKTGFTC